MWKLDIYDISLFIPQSIHICSQKQRIFPFSLTRVFMLSTAIHVIYCQTSISFSNTNTYILCMARYLPFMAFITHWKVERLMCSSMYNVSNGVFKNFNVSLVLSVYPIYVIQTSWIVHTTNAHFSQHPVYNAFSCTSNTPGFDWSYYVALLL